MSAPATQVRGRLRAIRGRAAVDSGVPPSRDHRLRQCREDRAWLLARVEELEAALRPFAEATVELAGLPETQTISAAFSRSAHGGIEWLRLPVLAFRVARRALGAGEGAT